LRVDTTPAVEWIDASSADERIADKRADAGASPDDARVDATSAVEWIDALLPSRADATSAVEWIDASSADERMAAVVPAQLTRGQTRVPPPMTRG